MALTLVDVSQEERIIGLEVRYGDYTRAEQELQMCALDILVPGLYQCGRYMRITLHTSHGDITATFDLDHRRIF